VSLEADSQPARQPTDHIMTRELSDGATISQHRCVPKRDSRQHWRGWSDALAFARVFAQMRQTPHAHIRGTGNISFVCFRVVASSRSHGNATNKNGCHPRATHTTKTQPNIEQRTPSTTRRSVCGRGMPNNRFCMVTYPESWHAASWFAQRL